MSSLSTSLGVRFIGRSPHHAGVSGAFRAHEPPHTRAESLLSVVLTVCHMGERSRFHVGHHLDVLLEHCLPNVRPASEDPREESVRKISKRRFGALAVLLSAALLAGACGSKSDDDEASSDTTAASGGTTATSGSGGEIKVGILHSLSGTMAISEVTV